MGTGRYVQKRGHYSKGVTYSVEEENPDQTVFLNDLKIPGGLEGSVLARGEMPELSGSTGTSEERPHFGQPHRAAHIKPGPVRAAAGTWGCATHPCGQGRDRGLAWWEVRHPRGLALTTAPSSWKVWYIFVFPWEGGGNEGDVD